MNPETEIALQKKRQQLAESGIELTPHQFLESIQQIKELCDEHGMSILEITKYDPAPPRPPYDFLFESQEEAQSFADKVKQNHNIECEINLIDFRRWKLTSK